MNDALKKEFREYVLDLEKSGVDIDAGAFLSAMAEPPCVSVKINRRKCSDPAETGYEGLQPVAWCDSGFYLPERPQFTLNPLLHAGVFYVQDASSMIHETLLGRILPLVSSATPAVLDLCAAPGGKTTSMINALPDGSLVVANEFDRKRSSILRENLLKWGYPDVIATSSPTSAFAKAGPRFDIVAVDAPCSGEGMMRKDDDARRQWSEGLVRQCAELQRTILADAIDALRPGGFLIYSTCTFNPVENEQQLLRLRDEKGLIPFDPQLPPEWGIGRQISGDIPALRFMPHLTRGEGQFAAILRKPEDGDDRGGNNSKTAEAVRKTARVILDGIPRTEMKGKTEMPTSEWALSTDFPADRYPRAEVDLATALSYLRHEAIRLPGDTPTGPVAICYKGHPLGMAKNLGSRANNLYPAAWRIRNL